MEVKNKFDYCGNCRTYCEYLFGEENYFSELNLENYRKYKDLYVYKCPKCGNISVDLSNETDAEVYSTLKDDEKFNEILDYDYLDGLDLQIYESHTRTVPANLYEAYSLIEKEQGNMEMYFRALNKSIELKEMIIQKYELTLEEDGDEEDEGVLQELSEMLYDNIDECREQLISDFNNYQTGNTFLFLIYVENLAKLGKFNEAKKHFDYVLKNSKIEYDLQKYFENMFEEME